MKTFTITAAALVLALLALAFLTSCSTTTTIPKFNAYITLPASEDGYWVTTVRSGVPAQDEGRVPKAEWALKRKRTIDLTSDDWQILRDFLLKNCLMNSCKYMVGRFDDLFYAIDKALGELPNIPIPGAKP